MGYFKESITYVVSCQLYIIILTRITLARRYITFHSSWRQQRCYQFGRYNLFV